MNYKKKFFFLKKAFVISLNDSFIIKKINNLENKTNENLIRFELIYNVTKSFFYMSPRPSCVCAIRYERKAEGGYTHTESFEFRTNDGKEKRKKKSTLIIATTISMGYHRTLKVVVVVICSRSMYRW